MAWTAADIPDLTGTVAVVTGANSGLGFDTAAALAASGAHVVLAARDPDKVEAARHRLLAAHPSASVSTQDLDLASLASVRRAAAEVVGGHPSIDLLVNNAGVMGIPERRTADGFEMQFGTNHLGHFAFTALLWPALATGGGARVVAVTSFGRHYRGRFDADDPPLKGRYEAWKAYGRSKMANLRFALELDRRSEGTAVRSVAAHPGLTHTELQANRLRHLPGQRTQGRWSKWVQGTAMASAKGVLPQLRAATAPGLRGGEFFTPRYVFAGAAVRRPLSPWTRRSRRGRLLWETSERMTGICFET